MNDLKFSLVILKLNDNDSIRELSDFYSNDKLLMIILVVICQGNG